MVIQTLAGLFYLSINCLSVYIVMNYLGLLYVKSEILRKGNESILNDSKDGIIIMDQATEMVMFINTAAKALNIREMSQFSINILTENNELKVDMNSQLFAQIDINSLE